MRTDIASGLIRIGSEPAVARTNPPRAMIYLDRDGTLIEYRRNHVRTLDDIVFLPNSLEALRRLGAADLGIAVTSNQSSVSRGFQDASHVMMLHEHVLAGIEAAGGRVDVSFICPHQPSDECGCRKPRLAMYEAAAAECGCPPAHGYVVGDAVCDVLAGLALGAVPVLVRTGDGDATLAAIDTMGLLDRCHVVSSFAAFVDELLDGWSHSATADRPRHAIVYKAT
jgi:D-glycero-D-manno-heptose 1,7-bisphosphate phosphatase